jgi:hypothetical protein
MAKTPMLCPFNEKLCQECQIYRGRHYYLCTCEKYRGYIRPSNKVIIDGKLKTVDMEMIKKLFEPWSAKHNKAEEKSVKIQIKLEFIDMETGKERYFEPEEIQTWKWGDPSIIRVVNGTHVTSAGKLMEIIRYHESRGVTELTIYEAPSFMLLGGG